MLESGDQGVGGSRLLEASDLIGAQDKQGRRILQPVENRLFVKSELDELDDILNAPALLPVLPSAAGLLARLACIDDGF